MDDAPGIEQPIDAAGVAAIVALEDPILRNLWITQAYADFAARLQKSIDGHDETWCGFAVWASTTAGQSIRREELPGVIAALLARGDHHQACIDVVNDRLRLLRRAGVASGLHHGHIVETLRDAVDAVSAHIAHGNTLVFAELGPLFVAFLELVESSGSSAVTAQELDAALDRAASVPVDPDLRAAFHHYLDASRQSDGPRRARAVLAGNVLAVAHEQRRLQADIAAAVDAGLVDAEEVVGRLVPRWIPHLVVKVLTSPVRRPLDTLLHRLWEELTTELLMTLRVPGAVLRLSHTLPPLRDGNLFPADLADLGDGDDAAPYRQWDRTGGTGRHDGAHDWVVLGERMSFIVNLFRSRQQDAGLSTPPFSDAQVDVIRQGRVPPPPLLPSP